MKFCNEDYEIKSFMKRLNKTLSRRETIACIAICSFLVLAVAGAICFVLHKKKFCLCNDECWQDDECCEEEDNFEKGGENGISENDFDKSVEVQ